MRGFFNLAYLAICILVVSTAALEGIGRWLTDVPQGISGRITFTHLLIIATAFWLKDNLSKGK